MWDTRRPAVAQPAGRAPPRAVAQKPLCFKGGSLPPDQPVRWWGDDDQKTKPSRRKSEATSGEPAGILRRRWLHALVCAAVRDHARIRRDPRRRPGTTPGVRHGVASSSQGSRAQPPAAPLGHQVDREVPMTKKPPPYPGGGFSFTLLPARPSQSAALQSAQHANEHRNAVNLYSRLAPSQACGVASAGDQA